MYLRVILLLLAFITASLHGVEKRIPTDADWLKLAHSKLASLDVGKMRVSRLQSFKSKNGYTIDFTDQHGSLRFSDGSWLIYVSHSQHKEDGIDDLTLIKTSKGGYFVNRGHVCQALTLKSDQEKIRTLEDFLSTKGMGPKGEPIDWEIHTNKPTHSDKQPPEAQK